jgi:CRISPR/Cas system-associated exonuclease Cas4 (RecB family)
VQLTKTDFIQYLNCPKSLWLLKVAPDEYPRGEFSVFLQKLVREGYEVERYVRQFFDDHATRSAEFQSSFETEDGLFARADAMETANGKTTLYEVKSSTSVKTAATHNHIKDACFQTICAERSGRQIDSVSLVHLNGDYVRDGQIEPGELLVFEDVTERIRAIEAEPAAEIDAALDLLRQAEIDRDSCTCLEKSRGQHCDSFALFNPNVPQPSIYSLPRLSANKRAALIEDSIFDLTDIPDDFSLSAIQGS